MQDESTPILQLIDVTKTYGKARGISDINLTVNQGEVFGFLGPNGAGKSTAINAILDLLRPQAGTIKVFGLDGRKDGPAIRRRVGFLSGDMETDPTLTGRQYLQFAAQLHGNVNQEKVDQLVARLKCDIDKRIKHLSRGNKQKIGLIAALMHEPDLLILDEPTSGLDPLIQAEFNQIIREHSARGKTTFISSHILSEVQTICDRVGFIRDGKLLKVSSLSELIDAATKRVTISFRQTVPTDEIRQLAGVSNLVTDNREVTFQFGGDDNALLGLIARYDILDIQIAEPNLGDLFIDYYSEEN